MDKIYITGSVGSGKSTLARRLSKEFGFAYYEMDMVIYEHDPASSSGSRKRSEKDRDTKISEALSHPRWVLEDAGRTIFEVAWRQADSIILLEPPAAVRKRRIVIRWIKQMLGIEKCGYKPGFWMLKAMFKWTKDYETGADGLKQRLVPYEAKISLLRNNRDIECYIGKHLASKRIV